MNKNAMYTLVAVLLVIIIGVVFFSNQTAAPEPSSEIVRTDESMNQESTGGDSITSDSTSPESTVPGAEGGITLSQVAEHNTPDDCWMVVEGKVYDVTDYIAMGRHPGGEAILAGCGKEATAMFNARGADQKPHSDRARGFLENYYLGEFNEME